MLSTVSIQIVAERTGLTAHAIRAWERRYGAIEPARSPGRHRMYSEEDIYRLLLLSRAASSGRLISRLAKLDNPQLRKLLEADPVSSHSSISSRGIIAGAQESADHLPFFDGAMDAVRKLDGCKLNEIYESAQLTLGSGGLVRRVIAPLARVIGEHWRGGRLTLAQEHFFAAISKSFLWNISRSLKLDPRAPRVVVATPLGQMNDTGAVIVATAAAMNGWKASMLGANLPAFELVGAVSTSGACALALSIVHPEDDSKLLQDLVELGTLLPQHIKLFVGGRASQSYLKALNQSGARVLSSLEEFDFELDAMRRKPVSS